MPSKKGMTLEELISSDKVLLTAEDISPVLGRHPQTIRMQAKERPELLGFPVLVTGKSVSIPRIPFLRFLGVA